MTLVKADYVLLDDTAQSTEEVFEHLANHACELGLASNAEELVVAFKEREVQGSTAMMSGIAIPHAKGGSTLAPAIVPLVLKAPLSTWESQDGEPIQVALGLIVPEKDSASIHLKLLSKLALMLLKPDFCELLCTAHDQATIASALDEGLKELEI